MRNFLSILIISLFIISCNSVTTKNKTVTFTPDTISNLKNPYMGWTLYTEGRSWHKDGKESWRIQDEAAKKYAGVFYIRWKWDEIEKEEGVYAWEHDSIFINLVQGALDRGLRLAFRIFTHTGTPKYVLDKAETFEHWGKRTPYADDPVFLEKYEKFIEAFGKKFNDPSCVDYVDCNGLGWWGEEHNIKYKNEANKHYVHDRICKAYAKAFDKVINVVNFGVRDEYQCKVAFEELEFSPRRDGLVSKWFTEKDRLEFIKHFPKKVIITEACYWGNNPIEYHEKEEGRLIWKSWAEYYDDVVSLSLKSHANYLDMRTVIETQRYLNEASDAALRFLKKGGYRIYPKEITYNKKNGVIKISHSWQNIGVGVMPNNNKNLHYKYKVAFALFNEKNEIIKKWYSNNIEISELIDNKVITAIDRFEINNMNKGKYKFGVGIVNTIPNDSKDIVLSINNPIKIKNEWIYICNLDL